MLTNKECADISVANAVWSAAKNLPLDEPQPTPKPSRSACQSRQKAWSKNWVVLETIAPTSAIVPTSAIAPTSAIVLETIAPTLPYLTDAHMAHSTSWVVRLLLTSNSYSLI